MKFLISSYHRDHRIFSKRKHATTILVVHYCQSSFSGGARRRLSSGGSVASRRRQFAPAGPILRQRDHKPILRQPQQPQSLTRKSGQLSNQVIKHTTIWVCTSLVAKKGLSKLKIITRLLWYIATNGRKRTLNEEIKKKGIHLHTLIRPPKSADHPRFLGSNRLDLKLQFGKNKCFLYAYRVLKKETY